MDAQWNEEAPELASRLPTKSAGTISTTDTVGNLGLEEDSPAKHTEDARKDRRYCCHWLRELYATFGNFIPFAVITYGVNQSVAWHISTFALRFYMKDVLLLDGATMGRLNTAAILPWNMKPFMGLLSDGIAIFGYHRRSYVIIAALCGLVSYILLGTVALPATALVVVMISINASMSTIDVIVDGKAAELTREVPRHASDLQSLFWGVSAIMGLLSSSLKGSLVEWFSPQTVLLGMTICSVSILLPALRGWLAEDRIPEARCCQVTLSQFRKHPSVSAVALLLTLVSTLLSTVQVFVTSKHARAIVTVACAIVVAVQSFRALKQITPFLGRTALFVFLRQCLHTGLGDTMFVWRTKYPGGPQLSPAQLGFVDCFGSLGLLVGVCIYNKFMTNWSFRRIFLTAQLFFFLAQLVEVVLVMRWNLLLGIPDFLFLVGDDTFGLMVSRFFYIPMCVLAAKVCPPNLEATLFATLLSINNLGWSISGFLGVTMCEVWGLEGDNFDNLPLASLVKACTTLLPLPLIFVLTPTFSPNDPVPEEGGEAREATTSQAAGRHESTSEATGA
ncbi:unnamed protein product [Symbiodinium natans]|uniref:Uncharacterized protein n=1 Tax=Symbiodinium natans TaxID=878477 RepID=A0A812TF26_9DINO|nr:unnamed protein product [Symbiodinium natans]